MSEIYYEMSQQKNVWSQAGHQWLTPSSQATLEAEIRRITVPGQPGKKKVLRPPSQQKKAEHGNVTCVGHPSDRGTAI
jgi:hypothetical protein